MSTASHPSRRPRSAMTSIEVMIAVAVLAIAVMGALTQISTLNGVRKETTQTVEEFALMRGLLERLQGVPNSEIGVPGSWSRHKAPPATDAGLDADTGFVNETDLRNAGFISGSFPLDHVRVYMEYFRAVSATDKDGLAIPGKSGGVLESGTFASGFVLPTTGGMAAWIAAEEIGPNDPVAIRITFMRRDGPGLFSMHHRRQVLVTGRQP